MLHHGQLIWTERLHHKLSEAKVRAESRARLPTSSNPENFLKHMNLKDLHLFLIRIYIGIDFSHHFAEKFGLLGPQAFDNVVTYFHSVGLPMGFVIIAGLCEFGAFIGFTFGLFTRIAAVGTALYLLISLFSGAHEHFGFTWANPGGGWEYPALWAFICLSYVLTGGGRWSVDAWLRKRLTGRIRLLSA